MTREKAKALVPFIQAFAEGKTIQVQIGSGWDDVNDPNFNNDPAIYRIKPEPREFYIGIYEDQVMRGITHHSMDDAKQAWYSAKEVIRVREVI